MTIRSKRLLLILLLLVFLVVIPVLALMGINPSGPAIKGKNVVVLSVSGDMLEYRRSFFPQDLFGTKAITLTDALSCLESASRDRKVLGLVLKIYPSGAGAAKCQELASAVTRFAASGKKTIAFSSFLVGNHYVVACAADSIFMPPAGYIFVSGPAASSVYFRGTLDKLGIKPNIHRIGEYKTAAESYTDKRRSPASREMADWILRSTLESFIEDICKLRGVGKDTVVQWMERGLFSPRMALEHGLIDGIRYWDEIEKSFGGRSISFVDASDYLRSRSSMGSFKGPQIAVVHAQGVIESGSDGYDPIWGSVMGAASVIEELRKARDDSNIKAVVFRIDSPGGDGIAGDLISREVELVSKQKPIVVSMSDVAASGGYEIAYRADRIVALPGTLTGSIGSITGKFNMRGLYEKLGISKDEIATTAHSLMYSDYRDFSLQEWKLLEEEHWAFYRGWIEEIARFRKIPLDSVDALSRGRVWTGDQASKNGLIDGVGDLSNAVGIACRLAGIADSSRVVLVHYPSKKTFLEQILSRNFVESSIVWFLHHALSARDSHRGLFIRHQMFL